LEELQRLLENLDDDQLEELPEHTDTSFHFDLCRECQRRFIKQPLGPQSQKRWQFSRN
jgi:hypothetical protein